MMFNGNTLMVNGTFDAPWSDDFNELSAAVESQASTVDQNTTDIATLKESVSSMEEDMATLGASSITAIMVSAEATEYIFVPADYDILLIGATPDSTHRTVCTAIPAAMAAIGLAFQVTDETTYTKWDLSSTGITRADGTGTLTYIYGVKL